MIISVTLPLDTDLCPLLCQIERRRPLDNNFSCWGWWRGWEVRDVGKCTQQDLLHDHMPWSALAWYTQRPLFIHVTAYCSTLPQTSVTAYSSCSNSCVSTPQQFHLFNFRLTFSPPLFLTFLYLSVASFRIISSSGMVRLEHGGSVGRNTNLYRILVGKLELKKRLERPMFRWENIIKMDL